jgi:hypothetical protein
MRRRFKKVMPDKFEYSNAAKITFTFDQVKPTYCPGFTGIKY